MPRTINTFQDMPLDREFDEMWRQLEALRRENAELRAALATLSFTGGGSGSGSGSGSGNGSGTGTGTGTGTLPGGAALPSAPAGSGQYQSLNELYNALVKVGAERGVSVPAGVVVVKYGSYTVPGELVINGTLIVGDLPGGAAIGMGGRGVTSTPAGGPLT
jgi:hypothetical protein